MAIYLATKVVFKSELLSRGNNPNRRRNWERNRSFGNFLFRGGVGSYCPRFIGDGWYEYSAIHSMK